MLIEKLPLELLDHVISLVDSLKDLAQCRLVCKFLDPLAQRAMFGKPIIVSSVSAANALRYHLENNQEMGKLITSMRIYNDKIEEADEFTKLLPLAFTPAMKSLEGSTESPAFYTRLVEIAEASNVPFNNLRAIPEPSYDRCCEAYRKAVLFFRHTLQRITISYEVSPEIPWHIVNQLGNFVNLTSLHIEGGFESVQDLDRMLAPCTRLQKLSLEARDRFYDAKSKEDLWEWMKQQHVEQVASLYEVSIDGSQQPDIVEYLVYKYPNMAEVSVCVYDDDNLEERIHYNYDPIWVEEPDTSAILRIIDALQSVPFYRLYYMENNLLPEVLEEIQEHVEASGPIMVTTHESSWLQSWMEMEVINEDLFGDYNDYDSDDDGSSSDE